MSSNNKNRKYSVTIEDVPEDELMNVQTGSPFEPHMYQYGDMSIYNHSPSDGEKEAWSHMNSVEDQARMEKIEDAPIAMKNANKVAHLVEKDIQQRS
ncbi:unnamed protein product [Absidia cylindrospora]